MPELIEQLRNFAGDAEHNLLDGDGIATAPQITEDYAAPGEPALLPTGVIYQADWKRYGDGMSRHARAQASALAYAGFPVALRSIADIGQLDGEIHPDVVAEVGPLPRITVDSVGLAVRQAVIHNSDFLLNLVCPKGARVMSYEIQKAVYDSTIVYTSWERSTVHPSVIEILKRCAGLWVPCRANLEAFVNAGLPKEMVSIVPFPYDPATSPVCQIPEPRGSDKVPQGKRFYSIGKWEPRKGYDDLIGAFLLGFTPKDKASLFLKTHGFDHWQDYPNISGSLGKWLDDPRVKGNGWTVEAANKRMRVSTRKLTDAQIVELHRTNNIYVSSSHGEAWDIPAFDAKCAGNNLVHCGYGGSWEYWQKEDSCIEWKLGAVHTAYGWEPDAQWAHYSLDALISAMRQAQPPEKRVHPANFYTRFGKGPVGLQMKNLLCTQARKLRDGLLSELELAGGYV